MQRLAELGVVHPYFKSLGEVDMDRRDRRKNIEGHSLNHETENMMKALEDDDKMLTMAEDPL